MSAVEPLVRVAGLTVSFGDVRVVDGVDLELWPGECLALVGESGSGKTVTSRTLLGLSHPAARVEAGELTILGDDVRRHGESQWRDLRGRVVGLISQDALVSLDPLRRIGAEVGEVLQVHPGRDGSRLSRSRLHDRVVDELAGVAMPDPAVRMRQRPHELSGGLRQRALVASATIADPRVLIADEPTTALDLTVQAQVIALLHQLKQRGTTLLLISHDLALVGQIADRVAVMKDGVVVETGAARDVLDAPQHAYTQMLLAATPSLHARGARLTDLPPLQLRTVEPAPPSTGPVLQVEGVSQRFRLPDGSHLQAVDDVSLTVDAGSTLGVVGESGSGKTTLGRIILGLQRPDAGEVRLAGQPWSSLPESARRPQRHLIQAVYQDPLSSFDPRRRVGPILQDALRLSGVERGELGDRAAELIGRVGLAPDLLSRRPLTLSGGQRQRVAIARALARNPRVIVCDEPVSALDVSIQAQVLDVFADIQEQLGVALVFISHDLSVVHHVSDRIVVMQSGVVVEQGDAEAVFGAPRHPYTTALLSALPQPFATTHPRPHEVTT